MIFGVNGSFFSYNREKVACVKDYCVFYFPGRNQLFLVTVFGNLKVQEDWLIAMALRPVIYIRFGRISHHFQLAKDDNQCTRAALKVERDTHLV